MLLSVWTFEGDRRLASTNWAELSDYILNAPTQSVTDSDTGTGVEGTPKIGTGDADTGTGTEGNPLVRLAAPDTGSGAEGTPLVGITAPDLSSAGVDAVSRIGVFTPDTGSGADAATISANPSSNDAGGGAEGVPTIRLTSSDTGSSVDAGTLYEVILPIADVVVAGWQTQVGGTTSLFATIDELVADDDTDYIKVVL